MTKDDRHLREILRASGISPDAIDAAWPSWWTTEAVSSLSARTELRFAIARRLGLKPKSLLAERVEFVWNDEARFKSMTASSGLERAAISSFGVALGRMLLMATDGPKLKSESAVRIRDAILSDSQFVDFESLIATCWALGVPVVHLKVFPLHSKRMHAMVVALNGRYAVLLGRSANYPAPLAFTLAHEIGHIMLGHMANVPALVDIDNPGSAASQDDQEIEADCFALELLTGSPKPILKANSTSFSASSLAAACMDAAQTSSVEPGTLALCFAYQTGEWMKGMAALRHIYPRQQELSLMVNQIAQSQLNWGSLNEEARRYLQNVMGLESGD